MSPLQHISFRDVAWLQAFPLTRDTVLDYLALSPFWDRSSTNDMLKMQQRHAGAGASGVGSDSVARQLEQMTSGVEFVVVPPPPPTSTNTHPPPPTSTNTQPQLFVVHKRRRLRPGPGHSATVLLAVIVVIADGNAYLGPTLADVVESRLWGATGSLLEAVRYGEAVLMPPIVDQVGGGDLPSDRKAVVHPLEAVEAIQLHHLNAGFLSKIM